MGGDHDQKHRHHSAAGSHHKHATTKTKPAKDVDHDVQQITELLDAIDSSLKTLEQLQELRSDMAGKLIAQVDRSMWAAHTNLKVGAHDPKEHARLQARFEKLAARAHDIHERIPHTGQASIDRGRFCEVDTPAGAHCNLTVEQRSELAAHLTMYLATSMNNFSTAIQNKRIDLLIESVGDKDTSLVLDLVFDVVGGVMARVAIAGLGAVRELVKKKMGKLANAALGKLTDDKVKEMVTSAADDAKQRVSAASDSSKGQADFLRLVQDQVKPTFDGVYQRALTTLDDDQLAELVGVYEDPSRQSVAVYESYIQELLDNYKSTHMADLGKTFAGGGRYELRGDQVIKRHGTGSTGKSNGGHGDQREEIMDDGRIEVVGTVRPDLLNVAETIYKTRVAEEQAREAAESARAQAWSDAQAQVPVSNTAYDRHH